MDKSHQGTAFKKGSYIRSKTVNKAKHCFHYYHFFRKYKEGLKAGDIYRKTDRKLSHNKIWGNTLLT